MASDSIGATITGQLDTCRDELFRTSDVAASMNRLFARLFEVRSALPPSEWTSLCRTTLTGHAIGSVLRTDPYTARAFRKPRGYAGDARLMDLLYRRAPATVNGKAQSDLGRRLFEYTTATSAAQAVRYRLAMLAAEIDATRRLPEPARILVLAAGHFREAGLSQVVQTRAFHTCVVTDHDAESLETITADYGRYGLDIRRLNVMDVIRDGADLGRFDLIYAAGLYDYLSDVQARRLNVHAFEMLRPGGRLLLCNFTPLTVEAGYMEAFGDWFLQYRTPARLVNTLSGIAPARIASTDTFHDPTGRIVFARVERVDA